jgi:glucosamine 6-phosphate synthetase-like amidotransferase/phosphosugar isomerase protein
MCGVFGFVNRDGGRMNLEALALIAKVTERRGPHAFGFAWIDSRGRTKCFKQTGRITDHLGLLRMAADARMLIGHCRYATQGNPAYNINNHPHPADGGWIVHNGTLPAYEQLVDELGLCPVSGCDSEILGLLVEQKKGTLLERCRAAVRTARAVEDDGTLFDFNPPLVLLGLWPRPARLVAIRQGNPLHFSPMSEGLYLASLADGMPGNACSLKDNTACLFTGKETKHATV